MFKLKLSRSKHKYTMRLGSSIFVSQFDMLYRYPLKEVRNEMSTYIYIKHISYSFYLRPLLFRQNVKRSVVKLSYELR